MKLSVIPNLLKILSLPKFPFRKIQKHFYLISLKF